MIISETKPLFAWDSLEDSPTIKTLREFLHAVPDAKLLEALRQRRGKGRADCKIRWLWGVALLTVALRHETTQATLDELQRNSDLRKLLGIPREDKVPEKWNMTRFYDTLGQEPFRSMTEEIFNTLVAQLGLAVADLGRDAAGDATALSVRRKRNQESQDDETADGLSQPSGGRKEYKNDEGKVVKSFEWFGMKLHLLVDTKHEVALSYVITSPKAGDGETLPELLEKAEANLPAGRIKTLAYDKAADSNDVHKTLANRGIKPVIQVRELWKEEPERMLPGHDGNSNIVYDEAGTVYCYDRASDPIVKHKMAFIGHEAGRGTLKYRCPARHEGWPCPSDGVCNCGKKYGKTVRVKQEIDLRRFPPIPRATKKFERIYKTRTSVERVNGRLKIFWGADDGNVTGSTRFHARAGVMMIVHAAFATLLASSPRRPIRKGRTSTLGQTRLSPIAEALQARMASP